MVTKRNRRTKHLFTDHCDTFVAHSLEHAERLYSEFYGDTYEDNSGGDGFADCWWLVGDDEVRGLSFSRDDLVGNGRGLREKVANRLLDALLQRGERTGLVTAVLNWTLGKAVGSVFMNGLRFPSGATWRAKDWRVAAHAKAGEWAAVCEPGFFSSTEW